MARSNTPISRKLGEALRDRVEVRSIAITGLFVLAVLYTLYFARAFLLPIVLAVLLDFLLSPVIRTPQAGARSGAGRRRARDLHPAGRGRGSARYSLAEPAREWMAKAPASLARGAEPAPRAEEAGRAGDQDGRAGGGRDGGGKPAGPQEVVLRGPRLSERLFGSTQSFLMGALETLILLYFLLAVGDLFLQKLIKVLPLLRDKKKAVAIARETEASISTYLFTVALVNVVLGIAVTLVMMPHRDAERAVVGRAGGAGRVHPVHRGHGDAGPADDGGAGDLPDARPCAAGAGRVPGRQPDPVTVRPPRRCWAAA